MKWLPPPRPRDLARLPRAATPISVLGALFVCACGPSQHEAASQASGQKQRAHGAVVARVGEHEIGVEDVASVAREAGFEPKEALDRLVAEALLGDLAETKGYASSSLSRRELKKAAARALLEVEVEAQIDDSTFSPEAVRARFEQLKPTLRSPEMRDLVRLVWVKPQGGDGSAERAAAERALARLTSVPPEARRGELGTEQSEAVQQGFTVKLAAVRVKNTGRKGDELAEAAKSITAPGFVPQVVETRLGFTVVLLEAITPPMEASFADHEATIRAALVTEGRRARTDELLKELRGRSEVTYHEDAIGRFFADDSLGSPR